MKTIIMLGFIFWRRQHCGCRRIVDAGQHHTRRVVAFRVAMCIRAALIHAGY